MDLQAERVDYYHFLENNSYKYLVYVCSLEEFLDAVNGLIKGPIISFFNTADEDLDGFFPDKPYLVVFNKKDILKYNPTEVKIVDDPQSIYEKKDNEYEEYRIEIQEIKESPLFYCIRGVR